MSTNLGARRTGVQDDGTKYAQRRSRSGRGGGGDWTQRLEEDLASRREQDLANARRVPPVNPERAVSVGRVTEWRCRVCGMVVETPEGVRRPPGWFALHMDSETAAGWDDPTLGLICSTACLLVSAMRPFGMIERQVREWINGAAT